ncbi:hypothetical protein BGZ52_013320 [Haplosporangium bisporale]|nr:hypothetical protein BGZ52_013320 [Haplosporangium bisporale]KAF9216101.1 hypothetical protein BGZ59_011027 [Podila verticillata]KAI9231191.1 MAG: hypothetical protein BYD32DRAFT_431399 [Podila humilis]KFH67081.1 hypothetical protein MVEG_07604 [Podila verticillata NRRL 6337]
MASTSIGTPSTPPLGISEVRPSPQPSGLRRFLRHDQLDLSRVVSSNLISAKALLVVRLFITLHLVAVFIATLYVSARDKVFYMVPTTFTNLSNIGLTAYYLTATYHSHDYVRRKNLDSLTKQHWFLTSALWLLYASVMVFHIVVPAIYWGMLFDPNNTMDTLNQYVDYSHHGVDFACILSEMVLNRMNLLYIHVLGPICMIILYMFLAWVYFAARGEWLYGFLDWSKGGIAAAWYIGLLLIFGLLFIMQMFIHRGRDSLFAKRRAVVGVQDGTLALENNNYRYVEDVENRNVSSVVSGQKQELPDKEELPESFQLQDLKEELPDDASPKTV